METTIQNMLSDSLLKVEVIFAVDKCGTLIQTLYADIVDIFLGNNKHEFYSMF